MKSWSSKRVMMMTFSPKIRCPTPPTYRRCRAHRHSVPTRGTKSPPNGDLPCRHRYPFPPPTYRRNLVYPNQRTVCRPHLILPLSRFLHILTHSWINYLPLLLIIHPQFSVFRLQRLHILPPQRLFMTGFRHSHQNSHHPVLRLTILRFQLPPPKIQWPLVCRRIMSCAASFCHASTRLCWS